GVAAVRYVSKSEALGTLKEVLGKDASVAEQLPTNPLPASLEVMLNEQGATPEGARGLITRLSELPETDEVSGGMDWVDRLARGRRNLDRHHGDHTRAAPAPSGARDHAPGRRAGARRTPAAAVARDAARPARGGDGDLGAHRRVRARGAASGAARQSDARSR